MGGKASRDKGCRSEREVVHILREAGITADRVPLSGAAEGFKGDVRVGLDEWRGNGNDIIHPLTGAWECKVRADGFKSQYRWLADHKALAFRADRKDWLVTIRLADLLSIIGEHK